LDYTVAGCKLNIPRRCPVKVGTGVTPTPLFTPIVNKCRRLGGGAEVLKDTAVALKDEAEVFVATNPFIGVAMLKEARARTDADAIIGIENNILNQG
jgi:hypothetical protein